MEHAKKEKENLMCPMSILGYPAPRCPFRISHTSLSRPSHHPCHAQGRLSSVGRTGGDASEGFKQNVAANAAHRAITYKYSYACHTVQGAYTLSACI